MSGKKEAKVKEKIISESNRNKDGDKNDRDAYKAEEKSADKEVKKHDNKSEDKDDLKLDSMDNTFDSYNAKNYEPTNKKKKFRKMTRSMRGKSSNTPDTYFYKFYKFIQNDCKEIDRDPFFKPVVLILRKVLLFYAEFVTSNLRPIYFSFGISCLWHAMFQQRFEHVDVQKFGYIELIIVIVFQYLWNVVATILANNNHTKIQGIISKILNTIILSYLVVFIISWLQTPGTATYVTIDMFTLVFMTWNYYGFGLVVLYFPIPDELNNIFVIVYSANITIFFWLMFDYLSILIYVFILTIWDLLLTLVTQLEPHADEYKYGLFYTIMIDQENLSFINEDVERSYYSTYFDASGRSRSFDSISGLKQGQFSKGSNTRPSRLSLTFQKGVKSIREFPLIKSSKESKHNSPSSKLSDRFSTQRHRLSILHKPQLKETTSNLNENKSASDTNLHNSIVDSKYQRTSGGSKVSIITSSSDIFSDIPFTLYMRTASLTVMRNLETQAGFVIEKGYGPLAMKNIQKSCQYYVVQGFHLRLQSIIFYNLILVICMILKTWVGVFMTLHLMGFVFLLKEALRIFFNKRIPVHILVLIMFWVTTSIIRLMVTPNFIKVIFRNEIPILRKFEPVN